MSARTLTKPTRCHLCGERMEAGQPFAWFEKSAFRASKYHTIPARWVVRHVGNCVLDQREAEAAEHQAKINKRTTEVMALLENASTDAALALMMEPL